MNDIRKEIYNNSLYYYFKFIPHYGIDKHNTKKSLLLLSMIQDLLEQNCYYGMIDDVTFGYILKFHQYILNKNPQLKYCRGDISCNYNNLGGDQFIEKYQTIDCDNKYNTP